jgi:RNA polymerase sigma factor (sigma-70 family)
MSDASNIILKENLSAKHTTGSQLSALVRKYLRCKDVDKKAQLRELIFNNSIRMIRKAACRTAGSRSEFLEDAFQTACIAFFNGLDKYRPRKNIQFTTYIYFWITKGIRDEYYTRNTIRLGRDIFKDEIYKKLHNTSIVQIDQVSVYDGDSRSNDWQSYLIDTRADVDGAIMALDSANYCKKLIDKNLSPIESAVIKLRYFYDETLSLSEIARYLNISHQSIQASEARGFWRLRRLLKSGSLDSLDAVRVNKMKHDKIIQNLDLDAIYENIINARTKKEEAKRSEIQIPILKVTKKRYLKKKASKRIR